MKYLILLILFLTVFTSVYAINMSSENYKIQWGNINMGGGEKSSASYNLTDTLGQIGPGQYDSDGFTLKSGFQYIYTLNEFSFSIDDLDIAFGSLIPESPSTDSNQLTISAPNQGFEIRALENHALKTASGAEIADTTCDTSCSETSAGLWTQSDKFGFGFNASGINVESDFASSDHYRQFANQELAESAQVIASSDSATLSDTVDITYKVNISTSQQAGDYENAITFIAIPMY